MLTDIEIAQQAKMKKIGEIAANLGIEEDEVEQYGHYKAKLNQNLFNRLADKPDGKLILVTAINPTPAGEGKTTTSVGLCEAMNKTGRKAILALREPSLGPVFGIKGGAAGGGYAQVVPMEDINLHFTPNTGPRLGSRSATTTFLPWRASASAKPTVVVVLPSPAGVGLMAVTRMSLPGACSSSVSRL